MADRENLGFVHVSGGLLSAGVLADALDPVSRRGDFEPSVFAIAGAEAPNAKRWSESVEVAFRLACELWDGIARRMDEAPVSELRESWLIPLLRLLDFAPVFQRAHLRSDDGRDTFAISHLGWDGSGAIPVHLIAGDLDQAEAGSRRAAHDELQRYLNRVAARWGIVANGRRLRILRDFHHAQLRAFVGFDLDAIFESRDFNSFRALYRLAHRSRFESAVACGDDATPRSPLDALFEATQSEGVQIGQGLQSQVRQAIEALARGLLGPELRGRLDEPKEGREIYRELLIVTYRILFLLFAEQRRMLPADGIYAETYSITALARIAETRTSDRRHCDLWEGLKATFRMVGIGATDVGVFPYNGQLFDLARTARLNEAQCENGFLLDAVRSLTHVTIKSLRQRVNYGELGVEELGSVYESILDYTLRRADAPTAAEDGTTVPAGGVYMAPLSTERKDLGAYYTPPALVDFVLSVSLDRLIQERLDAAGTDPAARELALLDLRVCDPACGSGAFLIGAIDRIALALATVRTGGEKPTEDALRLGRRDVLRHCIYGVDKDVFGVELCKVALWIHCAVRDLPLSFLDHKIQHGDSLVGWPLLDVPVDIPSDAYAIPSKVASSKDTQDRALKTFLQEARSRNDEVLAGQQELGKTPPAPDIRVDFPAVLEEDERVPADVKKKVAAYEGYLVSPGYRRFQAAADLWTASFFWSPDAGEDAPTTADYRRALDGQSSDQQAAAAVELLEEFPAFHWPLRFPEIRARGGFDCFLGNPPWEQFENREQEWFAARAPRIAALKGDERKKVIERLPTENASLSRRWRLYEQANQRTAEYTRTSGRFTSDGGKANTYLLFAETFADFLRKEGRAGVVVKSALALDKTAQAVWTHLVDQGQVTEFHDLVNGREGAPIFPAVAAIERFGVLALRGGQHANAQFEATLVSSSVAEARGRERQRFSPGVLKTINPHTRTLTSFRRDDQFRVALDIHERLSILDFDDGGANPWGLSYHTLFNSTTASGLFLARDDLERDGWQLSPDKTFRRKRTQAPVDLFASTTNGVDEALPLYEGQMVNRFDHRAKTYEGYVGESKYGKKPNLPKPSEEQKADTGFETEPRYWMRREVADERIRATIGDKTMMAFRDVARPISDRRCAKACILPRYPATHTVPILAAPRSNALALVGLFNSSTFDFLVCGHMPGGHVALVWMLAQIPAPAPSLGQRAIEVARMLSLTSHAVATLFDEKPHRWDAVERALLEVELDVLVAHAYGLSRSQYEVVLDSFDVLARLEVKQFGRYKFKEDCLAAYRKVG